MTLLFSGVQAFFRFAFLVKRFIMISMSKLEGLGHFINLARRQGFREVTKTGDGIKESDFAVASFPGEELKRKLNQARADQTVFNEATKGDLSFREYLNKLRNASLDFVLQTIENTANTTASIVNKLEFSPARIADQLDKD